MIQKSRRRPCLLLLQLAQNQPVLLLQHRPWTPIGDCSGADRYQLASTALRWCRRQGNEYVTLQRHWEGENHAGHHSYLPVEADGVPQYLEHFLLFVDRRHKLSVSASTGNA